jgi:hypothetical protein
MSCKFMTHSRRPRYGLLPSAFSLAALSVIAGMAFAQERSSLDRPSQKPGTRRCSRSGPHPWQVSTPGLRTFRLAEWATPLAGLNARPSHISAEQYYALPVDNLKTYPVYLAGREPEGYWRMLNTVGPKPMIEPEKLKNEADWIVAGRTVFEEMDHVHLRTYDPKFIEAARRGESAFPRSDGTAANLRWVPTKDGVALAFPNCANCHVAKLRDGAEVTGASLLAYPQQRTGPPGPSLINQVQLAKGYIDGGSPIRMTSGTLGSRLYQAFGVPWNPNDPPHEAEDRYSGGL